MGQKRLSQLKEHSPELLENEHIRYLAEQADLAHAIKSIADTEGGRNTQQLLLRDVVTRVHALSSQYKTASHAELMALCADLSSHLHLAKLFANAQDTVAELDNQLEEALTE